VASALAGLHSAVDRAQALQQRAAPVDLARAWSVLERWGQDVTSVVLTVAESCRVTRFQSLPLQCDGVDAIYVEVAEVGR
jgi:GAF domain-containing protein